jgi:hypothetical protein
MIFVEKASWKNAKVMIVELYFVLPQKKHAQN